MGWRPFVFSESSKPYRRWPSPRASGHWQTPQAAFCRAMGDQFDPKVLAFIHRELAKVDAIEARRVAASTRPPARGSPGAADELMPEARFARMYATQQLSAAIDHLVGWRVLSQAPAIWPRSPMTLLRGAIENAARCRWYVDRTVDPGTRVARGIAGRLHDQIERSKFDKLPYPGSSRPLPLPPGGHTAVERIEQIRAGEAERKAAGVTQGVGYADTIQIVHQQGLEWWYRLASGLSHGIEWGLQATTMERHPTFDDSGVAAGMIVVSPAVVGLLTAEAVDLADLAVGDLEKYVR
jgi:hypothetical protein